MSTAEKVHTPGIWNVKSLSTAEEYNLEALMQGIMSQELYTAATIYESTCSLTNVIHAVAKYDVGNEPREIFFFREGTVVMWNICDLEEENILQFLRKYEDSRYSNQLVQSESELMTYTYTDTGKNSHLKDGDIVLARDATTLDKYTFSNAMAQSVKLGIWEASLNRYVDSIEFVTEDLKRGRKLRMTQQEVLRKQGELFALRHLINLSSDLLDTPDFYWERDELGSLYQKICGYFSITKRTRVMNEKLNHCVELISILSSHLSDRHHIRLEWMIIILIMVEVAFEILHYIDRRITEYALCSGPSTAASLSRLDSPIHPCEAYAQLAPLRAHLFEPVCGVAIQSPAVVAPTCRLADSVASGRFQPYEGVHLFRRGSLLRLAKRQERPVSNRCDLKDI
ncbi:hypothetical protein KM043_005518 [Ampulex compressa]|nr:hypothetical protein KM043_005518 [Ampulex compressa]